MSNSRSTQRVQVTHEGRPVAIVEIFGPVADGRQALRVPRLDTPHSCFEVGHQVECWLAGEEADAGWSFAALSEGPPPSSI